MIDHIPDATKMIGDTPRTDAYNWDNGNYDDPLHAWGDFAAKLERELNSANADVERLTKSNLQLREGCEELKQRIKRLEEENDSMRADLLLWEQKEVKL